MIKRFFIILTLIIGDLLAISTVNENGGGDLGVDNEDAPNFQLESQEEIKGRTAITTTPCGDPPEIINGVYTLITVFMSGDASSRSFLLTYSCKPRHRLVGKQTLICSESANNYTWGAVPACVLDDYDDTNPTSRNTECSTNPSPAEILTCFPNVVVRYKFSSENGVCERYLACEISNVGFTTIEDCLSRCQTGLQMTTRKGKARFLFGLTEMTGGQMGPHCLPGVPITHSSCLDDSPYLDALLQNNITEILKEHNKWRDQVTPSANPPIQPLNWDDELAITAERWAAQCQFNHNTGDARKLPSRSWNWVGQNICAASYEQTWTQCINSWGSEYQYWFYGVGPIPSTAMVGHYTQVINANTTYVGCGRAKCKNTPWPYILVCNYGPGGNVGDRIRNPYAFPYTVGTGQPVTPKSVTVPTAKPTTTIPPTRPTPASFESGGLRGSQCLLAVDFSHSSCLSDSANLVTTIRFNYDEILAAHNKVRREVWPPAMSMPDLKWSEELAVSAERWAAQCRIAHNTGVDRRLPQWTWVGQNMRFATSDRPWQDTVSSWASEIANFRYGAGPVPANATVGHYTQLIWSETTHVGCGKAVCRNIFWNYIYVCNYGPGGNVGINGQSPFIFPYVAAGPGQTSNPTGSAATIPRDFTSTFTRPRTNPPTTITTTKMTYPPPRTRTTTSTSRPTTTTTTIITTPRTKTTTRLTTTAITPSPNNQMSGGLSGAQCFPNVDRYHSSCLQDSPNLVRTYRFGVDEVLQGHNRYRRNVQPPARNMPMLKYSEDLAIMAERWAAQCPTGHNQAETRATSQWPWVGQNICWKSGADETWTECIDAWGEEQKDWQYRVGPVPSNAVVGHYTQMIWADTLYVGCGKAYCKNTEWEYTLVCNYGPGGNIGNGFQSPYAIPYVAA